MKAIIVFLFAYLATCMSADVTSENKFVTTVYSGPDCTGFIALVRYIRGGCIQRQATESRKLVQEGGEVKEYRYATSNCAGQSTSVHNETKGIGLGKCTPFYSDPNLESPMSQKFHLQSNLMFTPEKQYFTQKGFNNAGCAGTAFEEMYVIANECFKLQKDRYYKYVIANDAPTSMRYNTTGCSGNPIDSSIQPASVCQPSSNNNYSSSTLEVPTFKAKKKVRQELEFGGISVAKVDSHQKYLAHILVLFQFIIVF